MDSRQVRIELKRSAKFDHQSCDGRFCKLDEHPEMQAIEVIKELEAKVGRLEKAIQTEINYHSGTDTHYRAERLKTALEDK